VNRALHLNLSPDAILSACTQMQLRVTAIEPLLSGGTRVVCASTVDSASLRKRFKEKLIEGPVRRSPLALQWGRS